MLTRRRSARLALGGARGHGEPPRKRHKSGGAPPPRMCPTSPFDWLPDEILCHVLGFLDPLHDVLPARQACRRWRRVSPHPRFTRYQNGLHGLLCRRYTEHFLQHHAVNNHAGLLRHYLTDKHVTPNFLTAMSHLVPIHTYSLPTLRWLHCNKGLVITSDDLGAMVDAGAIPLLEWVCHGRGAAVIKTRYDSKVLTSWKVIHRVARAAILKRSARVWGWLWSRRKGLEGSPRPEMGPKGALDAYLLPAISLALKQGFLRAVDDLLPRMEKRGHAVITSGWWGLFKYAIAGDDVDCIERIYAFCHSRGWSNEDVLILEIKALRRNACLSYVWLYRRLGRHRMHCPKTKVVRDMVDRYGPACHALLGTLLDCWPALVHELEFEAERRGLVGTDCLRKRLVKRGLYQLMYVLHDRECCRYTVAEMPAVLKLVRDRGIHIRPHHPHHKMLHYLARSVGLRDPETWDCDRPFETWK